MNCRINYLYERFPNNPEFASHLEKIELDIWNTLKNEGFPRFQYEGINYFTLSPKMSKEYKHQMKVMQNMRDKYGSQELFLMKKLPPFDYSLVQLRIGTIVEKEFEKFNNLDRTEQQEVIPTSSVFNEEVFNKYQKIKNSANISQEITKEQTNQIEELKQSDPRWNKYSNEDIQRFIDSVFPDSKVKDILKHTSPNKFEKFNKGQGRLGEGIYLVFSDYNLYNQVGNNVYNVIVNISNLKRYNNGEFVLTSRNLFLNEDEYSNQPQLSLRNKDKKEGVDAYVSTANTGTEYVVFEPEQIYILNSDKAIVDMEKFIGNTNDKYEDNVSCFI